MSSTQYTVTSTSNNFQLIINALHDYAKRTGIDLTRHPSAMQLELLDSPDSILRIFQEREDAFREYRESNRSLINCLRPAVQSLHAFSGVIGEAASLVSCTCFTPFSCFSYDSVRSCQGFPPAKAIFVGIDALLTVRTSPNILQLDPP